MRFLSPRLVFVAIVLAAAGLDAFAILYLQGELGLDPCPMCILSRMTFMALAAVCLVGAIHGPRGGTALKAYGLAGALFAAIGVGVSARHSWVQHFPPVTSSCGADLEFIMGNLPLAQALPRIFQGTGTCSMVDWTFLGLSIPEWAGLWFAGIFVLLLWTAFRRWDRVARA